MQFMNSMVRVSERSGVLLAMRTQLRWRVASLLFLATVINYLDRQALSLLAPVLRDQFGITNTGYSHIVFAFLAAYMIAQMASGRLMDRVGTRRGLTAVIAFWSAAAMLHAAAASALFFGFARFLLGLGEAGNWPGSIKAVSEWFPAKERGVAIGFFNSGSIVGALIAPPLIAWITVRLGWRAAFLFTGALGFLWLVPWLLFYRRPEEHLHISAEELRTIREGAGNQAPCARVRWVELLHARHIWSLVLARLLSDPVWWFYVFWLPEYLKRERHFSMEMIGMVAWIPFLTAALGSVTGGAAAGALIRRSWSSVAARKTVMALSAAGMLAGIPAMRAGTTAGALALISVVTFSYCAWASNILALPADLFPDGLIATVAGIAGTGGALGGMIFTLATGAAVDHFSYAPVFIAAALMPAAAAAVAAWGIRFNRLQQECNPKQEHYAIT